MDELSHKKTENLEVVTNSVIDMGLHYAAVGGAALFKIYKATIIYG